jgi:hypothetical protein
MIAFNCFVASVIGFATASITLATYAGNVTPNAHEHFELVCGTRHPPVVSLLDHSRFPAGMNKAAFTDRTIDVYWSVNSI